MLGTPTWFWGKLSSGESGRKWHPLVSHCADVAACCERILQRTILRRRLARWGELDDLDDSQIARLSVIAAFHDLGKFNYGFQNKSQQEPPFVQGHVNEALALFGDAYGHLQQQLINAIPVDALLEWSPNEAALQLLVASIGHHGRPGSMYKTRPHPQAWLPGPFGDPFEAIADLSRSTRKWFPAAYGLGALPLPSAPEFQHGFAGLVMLADWLGSDTSFFPYSEEQETDRMPYARRQAAAAAQAIGLEVGAYRRALGMKQPGFAAVSAFSARPAQQATIELPVNPRGSITILEAETGSGKTEAALVRFLRMCHAGEVDGLYFALPTRTAATQLHRRVTEALAIAFPSSYDRPPAVLAVPGYLRVDDREGSRLPGFEVLWNDIGSERLRHRGWAAEHPKRYLAGAVVVGTIDQVLLSTLMVPHAHMRATCAARHLLVIDEVHASDDYMIALLEAVLRFHVAAGGHAFLMSATLGCEARRRLLAAAGAQPELSPFSDAVQEPYPLLAHTPREQPTEYRGIQHSGPGKVVYPQISQIGGDPRAIAGAALEAARAGARVLVVRNLVRDCVATQEALEAMVSVHGEHSMLFSVGDVVAPHHSRYAQDDRRQLDAAVELHFGKNRISGSGKILVATQTVEQSLDLDADLLLTDLCPMDVLLQRVGRLHRHERSRPEGFADPKVLLLVPAERDLGVHLRGDGTAFGPHGYGRVYPDLRILEATFRLCNSGEPLVIPRDNRTLVEAATHPEALMTLTSELGGLWSKHGEHLRGTSLSLRRLAHGCAIDRTAAFDEDERTRFPSSEELAKITTRLGEDDRLVVFETPLRGPFGKPVARLTLPHFLVRGAPAGLLVGVKAQREAGLAVRFAYGEADYLYDRMGLRFATGRGSE